MSWRALLYLLFTALLAAVFAGIVAYYYGRRRKDRVESPKYRMLQDEDTLPGPAGSDRRG
ncbi:MAG TPA: CcoQ/FixQ family Cbb3-type cytochrome c oxidase assembly chaperone [Candidatus Deferrimicrobiaceae bacterium]